MTALNSMYLEHIVAGNQSLQPPHACPERWQRPSQVVAADIQLPQMTKGRAKHARQCACEQVATDVQRLRRGSSCRLRFTNTHY
jgi:hypothetical protein